MSYYLDDESDSTVNITLAPDQAKLLLATVREALPLFLLKLNTENETKRKEIRLSMLYRLKGLEIKLANSYCRETFLTRGQLGTALNLIAQKKLPAAADLFVLLLQHTYPEKSQSSIEYERARYLENPSKRELYRSPFTGKIV